MLFFGMPRSKPSNLMPNSFQTPTLLDPKPPQGSGDVQSAGVPDKDKKEKKEKKQKPPPKAKTPEQEAKLVTCWKKEIQFVSQKCSQSTRLCKRDLLSSLKRRVSWLYIFIILIGLCLWYAPRLEPSAHQGWCVRFWGPVLKGVRSLRGFSIVSTNLGPMQCGKLQSRTCTTISLQWSLPGTSLRWNTKLTLLID